MVYAPIAGELVNGGQSADDGIVMDLHMAGKGCQVAHDHMVPDDAVMGDMAVGHDETVAPDRGHSLVFERAAVDGNEFPEGVVVPDHQSRVFSAVGMVLGRGPDACIPGEGAPLADGGRPLDHAVGPDERAGSDLHLVSHHREGSDGLRRRPGLRRGKHSLKDQSLARLSTFLSSSRMRFKSSGRSL